MYRQSKKIVTSSLIGALILLGSLSSSTLAGGVAHPNDEYRYTNGYRNARYAGRITIDGYSTWIRTDRSMPRQIASAFRRAGYRTHITNGRVRIDFEYQRPSVQWSRDQYSVRMHWDYDELYISLAKHHRGRRVYRRRPQIRVARKSLRSAYPYCD